MVNTDRRTTSVLGAVLCYLTRRFLFPNNSICAFEYTPFASELTEDARDDSKRMTLRKEDALYFLLALACSSNIGSALTYTGNPQNMIVASDSLEVLPSYKFLIYMLPATLFSWIISKNFLCVSVFSSFMV
jgi:Na+/H+ antiporter NhaD/arsenite permease-like protein